MCIGNKINYIEIEKKNKIKIKNKSSILCFFILFCVIMIDGWLEIKFL